MSNGNPQIGSGETDPEALVGIIESLIENWSSGPASVEFRKRGEAPRKGRFLVIHGLVAHAHALGLASLQLLRSGNHLEVLPLVRAAFECAITAMWMAQSPDAADAFANEFSRNQRAASQTLAKANNPQFRDAAGTLPHLDSDALITASDAQARFFEQRCNDFKGGADLYVYYRLLCEYVHPTMRLVENYIEPNEEMDDAKSLRYKSSMEAEPMWIWLLAASLLWAGTAHDYVEDSRRRRSELRRVARELGTTRDMQLTDRARQRIGSAMRRRDR